jgi:hypothetical protein
MWDDYLVGYPHSGFGTMAKLSWLTIANLQEHVREGTKLRNKGDDNLANRTEWLANSAENINNIKGRK